MTPILKTNGRATLRVARLDSCQGKVKDIYESKELLRGPESIYRKEGALALSGDNS
jgi:hypothetical protein